MAKDLTGHLDWELKVDICNAITLVIEPNRFHITCVHLPHAAVPMPSQTSSSSSQLAMHVMQGLNAAADTCCTCTAAQESMLSKVHTGKFIWLSTLSLLMHQQG